MNYCLGTVQLGMKYGIQGNEQPTEESAESILNCAVSNGIDIFDTASAYGDAEIILGKLLNKEQRSKIRIVSKLPPDTFNVIPQSEWGFGAVQSAKNSLNRLVVPKLFAYLFHNASCIYDKAAVDALNQVYESGLTEHIGVSVYSPEEAMKALEYEQISVIQIPYNVFDQRLEANGFFDKAKSKGVILFARSSLLQGLLVMDPDELPDRVKFAKLYLLEYRKICEEYNCSPLETAIGYVNNNKSIDYIVFGVDNKEQLAAYLRLKDNCISDDMIKELHTSFSITEGKTC